MNHSLTALSFSIYCQLAASLYHLLTRSHELLRLLGSLKEARSCYVTNLSPTIEKQFNDTLLGQRIVLNSTEAASRYCLICNSQVTQTDIKQK